MEKVSNCIKYFIRKKIKEDPLWKNLKVIYSGHDIPGEGEHKIMQHIRDMRSQPNYQPNTRHCMYGQDADLIMLALATHEPHFFVLREEVTFGQQQASNKDMMKGQGEVTLTEQAVLAMAKPFQFVKISVLREYLEKVSLMNHKQLIHSCL